MASNVDSKYHPSNVSEENEDLVDKLLRKTGCEDLHYKLQECHAEHRDWRKCQDEVKEFRNCIAAFNKQNLGHSKN